MSGIDIVAIVSFAVLIVSWAILPASGWSRKSKSEETSVAALEPATES